MATFTRTTNNNPSGLDWDTVSQWVVVIGTATATSVTLQNTDGTVNVITGTGFTFDGSGNPLTGNITSIVQQTTDPVPSQIRTLVYAGTDPVHTLPGVFGSAPNFSAYLLDAADVVIGNNNGNTLAGYAGDDVIRGFGGGDNIDGGAGFDEISAMGPTSSGAFLPTAGMVVTYAAGTSFDGIVNNDGFGSSDNFLSIERIRGTQLADTFNGNSADNSFRGLAGNDILNGGAGFDEANYGQDTNYGATQGVVVNLSGATLTNVAATGGPFTVASNTAKDGFGNTDTLNSIENAVGTSLNDYLAGSAWDNTLSGGGGNDTLVGNDGFDFFTPGAGTDIVNGTPLNHPDQSYDDRDFVAYSDNNNGVGVVVNLSNAAISGVTVGGVVGPLTVGATSARDWSGATDTLIDIERARGTMSADWFRGSDTANLREERFRGLGGDDHIDGGAGTDAVDYSNDDNFGGLAGVTVNLALGTATDGFGAHDTLISIENVIGTDNNDILTGDAGRNSFRLMGGSDTVDGGGGATDQVDMYIGDIFGGAGATVNLTTGSATGIGGGVSTLVGINDINGSEGSDNFTGNANDNLISGSGGDDVINAMGGDDIVYGGPGNNTLDGGDGNDILAYLYDPAWGQYYNLQYATDFPSAWTGVTVNLATHTATNFAGGTDTITNFENVLGTFFNDTITGDAGNNAFDGLAGDDVIDGGDGVDEIYYGRWDNNGRVTEPLPLINFSSPNGVIVNLSSTSHQHTISSGTFNVAAGHAADGEGGTDTLISIENIQGSEGADFLYGSAGDNFIFGDAGADFIDGGDGIDTVSYNADFATSGEIVTVNGTSLEGDTLVNIENLIGTKFTDTLTGDAGANRLEGVDGDDTLAGLGGNDFLDGGLGNDTADYSAALQAVNASLGGQFASGADIGSDTLISIENINGGAGNDSLTGDASANVIVGNSGDDVIFAGDGADNVSGGDGNDTLVGNNNLFANDHDTLDGGAGNDIIQGEAADTVIGGSGQDFLYSVNDFAWNIDLGTAGIEWMQSGFGNDVINAATQTASVEIYGGGGSDTITGSAQADFLWAGAGNDIVVGGDGADLLFGDLGADSLSGGAGNDRIYVDSTDTFIDGGAGFDAVYITGGPGMSFDMAAQGIEFVADFAGGNDTLNGATLAVDMTAYASGGNDIITGGSGNDFLWGEAGNDTITGGIGNDTLVGGIGIDVLTGGAGIDTIYLNSGGGSDGAQDTVVFTAGWGTDFVFDFVHGEDKIDLTAFGTSFGALNISNSFGHAYIHIGAGTDLIAVANNGGLLTAGDFLF